ncbi:MAG: energy transducer TonB [Nitrospira sp.]|nr:energy transducer TonB [Nitrospira sp.]
MASHMGGQHRTQGWIVSVFVHCLALTVVLGFMSQVKPVLPKDPFTWDVALVEPQRRVQETRQAEATPPQAPVKPIQHSIAPAPSKSQMVVQQEQPRKVTQIKEQQPTEVQQPKQVVVEPIAPVLEHEVVTAEPVITTAPVQQAVTQPVIAEAPASEAVPVTHDSSLHAASMPATVAVSEAEPVVKETLPQVAVATRPAPSIKVDHGWLADSLRRRLAEIKRYPSTARLNGWEGKVVLRAVIRADGHLTEVKVHRSSGYDALDNAAIEAIRLVCPLHMHQPLGTSEVAVYVPIVYSLAS